MILDFRSIYKPKLVLGLYINLNSGQDNADFLLLGIVSFTFNNCTTLLQLGWFVAVVSALLLAKCSNESSIQSSAAAAKINNIPSKPSQKPKRLECSCSPSSSSSRNGHWIDGGWMVDFD
jgi:hypothetical protein